MIYPLIRESIIKRNENFKIFSSLENDIIIIHYRYYKNTRYDDLSINQRPIRESIIKRNENFKVFSSLENEYCYFII